MNLDKIIAVIENQLKVDETVLEQAKKLHEKFPFTSIFPMIILKGLKDGKNIHFEGELKKLAIQVNDRAVLERYIESIGKEQEGGITSKEAPTVEIEVQKEDEPIIEAKAPKTEQVDNKEIDEPVEPKLEIIPPAEEKKPEPEPQKEEAQLIEKTTTPPSAKKKEEKEEEELSSELSPETLAIIAEINKKYGVETTIDNDEEQEVVEEEEEIVEKEVEEKPIRKEEPEIIQENIDEIAEVDNQENETEKIEEVQEDEEEIIEFSLEESLKPSREKPKKKSEKKKKKAKKLASEKKSKKKKDKELIESKLKEQKADSPFKFKEFEGEDSEYYHLEIDFSDLEPIAYEDQESEEDLPEETFIEIPKKAAKKKKAQKISPEKSAVKTVDIKEEQSKEKDSSFNKPVKIEVTSKSELTFLDWLKANKTEEKEVRSKEKSTRSEKSEKIIDKFIEDEPSISQGKSEFFSPTRNAKKSLQDDMEIVSETLADLHVYQGSYKKAKVLYQKLILKFPEKKSLFAKKLEEISELEKEN